MTSHPTSKCRIGLIPQSKCRIGLIPLRHIAVTTFGMIHLLLTVIFIPLIRQQIRLKPDCSETSDAFKLKCVIFERLALSPYPCPKRRIGPGHIAVTVFGMICLQLTTIFIPLIRQQIFLKLDCIKMRDTFKLKRGVFERLALIYDPSSKQRICLVPRQHIAMAMFDRASSGSFLPPLVLTPTDIGS